MWRVMTECRSFQITNTFPDPVRELATWRDRVPDRVTTLTLCRVGITVIGETRIGVILAILGRSEQPVDAHENMLSIRGIA